MYIYVYTVFEWILLILYFWNQLIFIHIVSPNLAEHLPVSPSQVLFIWRK